MALEVCATTSSPTGIFTTSYLVLKSWIPNKQNVQNLQSKLCLFLLFYVDLQSKFWGFYLLHNIDSTWSLISNSETQGLGMALLWNTHENLSLIPRTLIKSWVWWHSLVIPALGKGSKRIPGAHWLASLPKSESPRQQWSFVSKQITDSS